MRIDKDNEDHWYHKGSERIEDDIEAWHHHVAKLRDIVRGTRHHIADTLPIMKRLALTEQTEVEFVAYIAREAFAEYLSRESCRHIGYTCQTNDNEQTDNDEKQATSIVMAHRIERRTRQCGYRGIEDIRQN